jgi:hypothetical protein
LLKTDKNKKMDFVVKKKDDSADMIANLELLGIVLGGSLVLIMAIYCCYRYKSEYN